MRAVSFGASPYPAYPPQTQPARLQPQPADAVSFGMAFSNTGNIAHQLQEVYIAAVDAERNKKAFDYKERVEGICSDQEPRAIVTALKEFLDILPRTTDAGQKLKFHLAEKLVALAVSEETDANLRRSIYEFFRLHEDNLLNPTQEASLRRAESQRVVAAWT